MYGGYGSICKFDKHRPGSLLYYPVSSIGNKYVPNTLSNTLQQNTVEHFKMEDRFFPKVPEKSLSYRFDGVNLETPNAYAEYNSSCKGVSLPRYNEGQRKSGPQGCTSCKAPSISGIQNEHSDSGLYPILDPKFNLREVAKHIILLEDHLFQSRRRCDDCINKHRLTIEAFLEEAITLDKKGEYIDYVNDILSRFKRIMGEWVYKVRVSKSNDVNKIYAETAQKLREIRKPLCGAYCDFC